MSKRLSRKPTPQAPNYIFTDQDRQILEATSGDLHLFSEWFFETPPIQWQTWFHHQPQKRKCLIAGIRSGKTFGISLGFPHHSLFNPYSIIANASISADQAKIVYYNVLNLISRKRFERFVKDTHLHPYPYIELINGSQMWFRSVGYEAELWRGWEFDWINIDEAAYVGSKKTYDTLQGRLLGHNTFLNCPRADILTMTSSPKGRSWLYEEYQKGLKDSPSYNPKRHFSLRVRTTDNPHIDKEALQELMNDYSEKQRQQELEGAFLDPEDAVFSWEAIRYMCDNTRAEVFKLTERINELSITPNEQGFAPKVYDKTDYARYELPPEDHHTYLISWDLGTSATTHLGRNATVGMVFDISERPWKVVAYRRERAASYAPIIQWIREWHARYNYLGKCSVETVIDATGSGQAVEDILKDEYNLDVDGMVYNTANKPEIITAGQAMIEQARVIAPPIRALMDELSNYEMHDKKITQDCVMAFCQGLHRARMRDHGSAAGRPEIILPTRTQTRIFEREAEQRYADRRQAGRLVRTNRRR